MIYLMLGIISFLIALNFTPLFKRLSIKLNIVDHPNYRKIHKKPKALMGGVAIYLGFLVAVVVSFFVNGLMTKEIIIVLCGSTVMLILGLIDDKYVLGATKKFALPSIASIVVVLLGLRVEFLQNEFLNVLFSFIWLIGIVNAFNFIDNMDGVTTGVAFISSMLFGILGYSTGQPMVAGLSFSLAGACLGFLYHNFNPAKIFAGDAGSMFLGFVLANIALLGNWKSSSETTSLLVPIFILGYAIFDVTFVTMFRLWHGKKPWIGDKNHSTHRIKAIGYSTRITVFIIYLLTLSIGLTAFIITHVSLIYAVLTLCLTGLLLCVLGLILAKVKT